MEETILLKMEDFNPIVVIKMDHFTCPTCNSIVVGLEKFKIHEKGHEKRPSEDTANGQDLIATLVKQEEPEKLIEVVGLENGNPIPGSSSTVQTTTKRTIDPTDDRYGCFLCGVRRVNHEMFVKHMVTAHQAKHPELVKGLIKLVPAIRRERIKNNRALERERDQNTM